MSESAPNLGQPTNYSVVIGDAFVDLIAQVDEQGMTFVPKFGGSSLNVAVGISRLGVPVQLAATLMPGTFGTQVQEFCEREGIDIASLSTPADQAFVSVATPRDGRVSYEYFGELSNITEIAAIPETSVKSASIVHAGSTVFLSEMGRATVELAFSQATGFVSMDLNPRAPLIADKERYIADVADFYPLADLIKFSDEDLEYLFPRQEIGEVAADLSNQNNAVVIVTRGADATLLAQSGELFEIDVPKVRVVDATGAGDSFTASLLADVATIGVPSNGAEWAERIRRANRVAAVTCQGKGGAESMPTRASMGL